MRFLQDVVVRGDTATTAVVQDNVFEDDVVGGDEDAVNNVFEILGTIGGTLIALSLAPQVYKTYQTRSALDISYFYQGIYIAGLSLVNLYAIVEGLWPVYVPALIELSMIVSLTVMKVIYDREKLKEAAQRQLSNSWQSACRLSQASRNLILDVSKGSVDLLNLSRHRHSAADAGNNDSGGGFSYFGRSRGSHGKGTTDRSSNELHALHVAVENACREDEEEDGPDEMKAKEIKVESNGDGEKDATVEVDHIEAHRDGKETNSEV